MGETTGIAWTDHTFNPWWGCKKVSPACDNCYAERDATRFGMTNLWTGSKRTFNDAHFYQPIKWNEQARREGKIHRVFCGSMCDIFEDDPTIINQRERVFGIIEKTQNLEWLLLTKRAQNISKMIPEEWKKNPPSNVRVMVTVENQHYADQRIPLLLSSWSGKNGLSVEPMLGEIDISNFFFTKEEIPENYQPDINWVICGGESGINARPMNIKWVDKLYDQCKLANAPFFFKQWGEWLPVKKEDVHLYSLIKEKIVFKDGEICVRVGRNQAGHLLHGKVVREFPV